MKTKLHRYIERTLLCVGIVLLVAVGLNVIHREVSTRRVLADFDEAQAARSRNVAASANGSGPIKGDVDISLWSDKRVREYRESLVLKKDAPMGILSLDRLRIRVPIYEGTDDLVLNRGVGWIVETARPGRLGDSNTGLAGHRDGFFRALKDIAIGEQVELATPGFVSYYVVDSTEIVTPEDVGVLRPRGVPSLTLVTCYPFYFVGDAPKRFIVHATLKQQSELRIVQKSGSASTNQVLTTREKEND